MEAPPERASEDLPAAPTAKPNSNPPPPVQPPPTTTPPPSSLLPALPTAVPNHLNLGLPNASPGKVMQDDLQDAVKHAHSGTYSSDGGGGLRGSGGGGHGGRGAGVSAGNAVSILTPTEGVDFNSYINRLVAKVKQNWYTVMPESAYMGDKGIVAVTFRINRDGSFPGEALSLERTSGKDPLDTAAVSAIRSSNPFDPLPPQFKGPYIELRFIFFYNTPIDNAQ